MKKMNLSLIATGIVLATQASALEFDVKAGLEYGLLTIEQLKDTNNDLVNGVAGAPGSSANLISGVLGGDVAYKLNDITSVGLGLTGKYSLNGGDAYKLTDGGKRDHVEENEIPNTGFSQWSLTPAVNLAIQPNDSFKLTGHVSFGHWGGLSTKVKGEETKVELDQYGFGFNKGLGAGVGAQFLVNENFTIDAELSWQSAETKDKFVVDTHDNVRKAQSINTRSIGLNVGYMF